MDCKEFAITIQCLWQSEVGKDRLDEIIPELLEFLDFPITEETKSEGKQE